ncbi:MAG: Rrf2 family transcriptional regulator [Bacteroidales bacterium]|nr:Rrf2 family transcriptional regulator [Bacteroidales bacterium]
MSKIVNISEAASLAIHSLALIAQSNEMISTIDIAKITGFSKNHLSKVLQILVKNGYINSTRGPKGGFVLKAKAEEIFLLEIYELFEGKLQQTHCSLHSGKCPFKSCVFGGLTGKFTNEFYNHMNNHTIAHVIH